MPKPPDYNTHRGEARFHQQQAQAAGTLLGGLLCSSCEQLPAVRRQVGQAAGGSVKPLDMDPCAGSYVVCMCSEEWVCQEVCNSDHQL